MTYCMNVDCTINHTCCMSNKSQTHFYSNLLYTVCPRSSDPLNTVIYYTKWATTSWTDGISCWTLCAVKVECVERVFCNSFLKHISIQKNRFSRKFVHVNSIRCVHQIKMWYKERFFFLRHYKISGFNLSFEVAFDSVKSELEKALEAKLSYYNIF